MEYNLIQSGSSGNCLILNEVIALDMGVPYKKVSPYVKELQLVFVGHQHGDHFKKSTINRLAEERPLLRFCGGEWMAGMFTLAGVSKRNIDVLEAGKRYDYGSFQIEPFNLHHDVPNIGLKIYLNGEKIIYIVDTGHVDDIEAKGFDYYFLEANHAKSDIESRAKEKIERGEFAYELRAAANHLSYEQAMDFLSENMGPNSQYVLLHQHKEEEKQHG